MVTGLNAFRLGNYKRGPGALRGALVSAGPRQAVGHPGSRLGRPADRGPPDRLLRAGHRRLCHVRPAVLGTAALREVHRHRGQFAHRQPVPPHLPRHAGDRPARLPADWDPASTRPRSAWAICCRGCRRDRGSAEPEWLSHPRSGVGAEAAQPLPRDVSRQAPDRHLLAQRQSRQRHHPLDRPRRCGGRSSRRPTARSSRCNTAISGAISKRCETETATKCTGTARSIRCSIWIPSPRRSRRWTW